MEKVFYIVEKNLQKMDIALAEHVTVIAEWIMDALAQIVIILYLICYI